MRLESDSMTQQSAIASINAEYSQAKMQLDTDEVLGKQGLVPLILLKVARVRVQDLANRLKVEQQRLAISGKSDESPDQRPAVAHPAVARACRTKERPGRCAESAGRHQRRVAAGFGAGGPAGHTRIQHGARCRSCFAQSRTEDCRDPDQRRQTRPAASRSTRAMESFKARVSRIDPAAREGTFTVDAELTGPLPASARPDLSVDGTIELERLDNVLYVGPARLRSGTANCWHVSLSPDGQEAVRTQVALGRNSVSTIEIVSGLARRRSGDPVGHVGDGQLRPHSACV